MSNVRIVVIEDNRLLREGIVTMLKERFDFSVVDSFGDNDKITMKIREAKPHVLLVDIGLRNQNSLRIVKAVKKNLPDVNIIAMDLVPMQEDIYEFVQAGVSGFIVKDASTPNFLKTVHSVAEGTKVLPSFLTESLFSQIVSQAISRAKTPSIVEKSIRMTKRERQVIMLIADCLGNKEIAGELGLSTFTVKSHVHNILEKLAIRSRVQIANYARTNKDFAEVIDSISLLGE